MVDVIARTTLGEVLAGTGDLRGCGLCHHLGRYGVPFGTAESWPISWGLEQRSLRKRIYISIPLFAAGAGHYFLPAVRGHVELFRMDEPDTGDGHAVDDYGLPDKRGRNRCVGLLPALVMTYVCMSYVFISPLMCGMRDRAAAYLLGGALTLAILITMSF